MRTTHRKEQFDHPQVRHTAVVLVTSLSMDRANDANNRSLRAIFAARRVASEEVDGAYLDESVRDAYFALTPSGEARYPQIFIREGIGPEAALRHVGDYEAVVGLNEDDGLPADYLAAHPDLPTLSRCFARCRFDAPAMGSHERTIVPHCHELEQSALTKVNIGQSPGHMVHRPRSDSS